MKFVNTTIAGSMLLLLAIQACDQVAATNPATKITPTKMKSIDAKTMARRLFAALQTGNATQWKDLYPTDEEFKNLMQLMVDAHVGGLTQEHANALVQQQKQEAAATYAAEFKTLQKQAAQQGVEWKKATYSDFIFDSSQTAIPRKYINGDLWFNIGRTEFAVEGIEAVETESGYKLQAVKGIRKLQEAD